ncbi:MAG TPA: CHAT domain-containing protein [Thermoanaerobaculia bacterium]|nr:CHAT domain-containing protein [Thermoanaerobaculia bacterium]
MHIKHIAQFLGLAALLAGCRQDAVQGCLDLSREGRHEAAAETCAKAYAATGNPRAGAAVVVAHYSLGHPDEVLAWVDRLAKDGKVRPGVRTLAAAVHEQRGENTRAEEEYRRDVALYRAEGNPQRVADLLYRLSLLAWQGSRYREAFLYAGESLEEAKKARDPGLEAAAATALYTALYAVGDLEGARRALEAAGAEDPSAAGSERRVRFLANRGGLLADEGRRALARRDLEQALELGADLGDPQIFRSIHLNLTNLHLDEGDLEKAAYHLEEAWKHAEPGKPPGISLLYYRARVDLAHGRAETALKSVDAALDQDPPADWAWDLELVRGEAEEARGRRAQAERAYLRSIAVVEEMRRSLAFDELKSWLLDRKRQPFEALFRLQASAGRSEEALATAERAQARTLLDAFLSPANPPETGWSPARATARMELLDSLLPAMSESPVASLRPVGEVLRAFGDRHGLVYFEAGDALWLAVIAGGRVRLEELSASPAEVRRLGDSFLAHPEDAGTAGRLGAALLPPGSLPRTGRTVHVVADGPLGNLPFAALRHAGRYLVMDHPVVHVPSLSALAALESRSAGPAGPAVVLADAQGDLPAASAEAREVGRALGGVVHTGGAATAGRLREASAARVLHLATHTGLGPRGPWLGLADRRVPAVEIVAGRIGPPLAVLASCASGTRPGRPMWGSLGAAFLAAGSRSVLASLWSVEDEKARELVVRFYAEGGAADPASALARTQRVAIGRGASPNSWAAFVLFGSDRPSSEPP